MRFILFLIFLGACVYGGYWSWKNVPQVKKFVNEKITRGEFPTLEIRYTPQQIMELHKGELLKGKGYSFLEPKLSFYPCLLMETKYSKDHHTTTEGVLLWGLSDGEMITDASSWNKTHGFQDCLVTGANKSDFNIIRALVKGGGSLDRDQIYRTFNVESETIDSWIESCSKKKLIVLSGNLYRLHFANPKLETEPKTLFNERIVTQTASNAIKVKERYTPSQIKKLTRIAFGKDFAIRSMSEVFLPVYNIAILNPDGSQLTTSWNALNGKRMDSH